MKGGRWKEGGGGGGGKGSRKRWLGASLKC